MLLPPSPTCPQNPARTCPCSNQTSDEVACFWATLEAGASKTVTIVAVASKEAAWFNLTNTASVLADDLTDAVTASAVVEVEVRMKWVDGWWMDVCVCTRMAGGVDGYDGWIEC